MDATVVRRDADPAVQGRIYEYACHQSDDALPDILRATRMPEAAGSAVDAPTPFTRFGRSFA